MTATLDGGGTATIGEWRIGNDGSDNDHMIEADLTIADSGGTLNLAGKIANRSNIPTSFDIDFGVSAGIADFLVVG